MSCSLALVNAGLALGIPFGGATLPHGSLVRTTGTCQEGVSIEVLSTVGWYPGAGEGVGARGCVAADRVTPLGDAVLVALVDAPGAPAGTIAHATDGCAATAVADLSAFRAVSPDVLARVERVRAAYTGHFGPLPLHRLRWTDWGRVALPLDRYTPERIVAEQARERLLTAAQRERTVVGEGPTLGTVPAWTHFWGADPPDSDLWAEPDTLVALFGLTASWIQVCGQDPRCVPSFGDLAYYYDTRPDPLGHKDHVGDCVDLRLFRTDGSRYEAWWNRPDDRTGATAYDRARTAAFLRHALATGTVDEVYFNDPAVVAEVPGVRPQKGHDDHVHLCFAMSR